MKNLLVALVGSAAICLLFSCSKSKSDTNQPDGEPVGVVTPVGVTLGEPIAQKTIGENGGFIQSRDGRVSVEFPAGALAGDQQISIETITDENPLGTQKAYRLQPHNIDFEKPVKIVFHYQEEDHIHSVPEALAIATQDAQGIWQIQGGAELNKSAQTLSVTTTHFSDWSFFESFRLNPVSKVVSVNATVQLELTSIADLFVPLVPGQQTPIGEPVSLTPGFVKKWTLSGAGNLQSQGAKATYKAPATVPNAPNPVAVTVEVELRGRGRYLVVSHITIQNDDGEIEFSVGGAASKTKLASPAVNFGGTVYGFGDSDGDEEGSYIFIMWDGGVGSHAFKDPNTPLGTHVQYEVTGGLAYAPYYVTAAEELVKSGGGVTITSMGEDDGFVKGTFNVAQAGISPDLKATTTISGKFRVKKGW